MSLRKSQLSIIVLFHLLVTPFFGNTIEGIVIDNQVIKSNEQNGLFLTSLDGSISDEKLLFTTENLFFTLTIQIEGLDLFLLLEISDFTKGSQLYVFRENTNKSKTLSLGDYFFYSPNFLPLYSDQVKISEDDKDLIISKIDLGIKHKLDRFEVMMDHIGLENVDELKRNFLHGELSIELFKYPFEDFTPEYLNKINLFDKEKIKIAFENKIQKKNQEDELKLNDFRNPAEENILYLLSELKEKINQFCKDREAQEKQGWFWFLPWIYHQLFGYPDFDANAIRLCNNMKSNSDILDAKKIKEIYSNVYPSESQENDFLEIIEHFLLIPIKVYLFDYQVNHIFHSMIETKGDKSKKLYFNKLLQKMVLYQFESLKIRVEDTNFFKEFENKAETKLENWYGEFRENFLNSVGLSKDHKFAEDFKEKTNSSIESQYFHIFISFDYLKEMLKESLANNLNYMTDFLKLKILSFFKQNYFDLLSDLYMQSEVNKEIKYLQPDGNIKIELVSDFLTATSKNFFKLKSFMTYKYKAENICFDKKEMTLI